MLVAIRITSDFICPWCLIGERRLAAALRSLPEEVEVNLKWLPFELNPDMPVEGMDRKTYRSLKFGSWARSQALDAQTVAAARDDDVAFAYDAIERTPNTLLAHRLAWFAGRHGVQHAVVDAVLSGYFERGQDIGRIETLTDLAAAADLDRREVVGFLESEAGTDEVRALERAGIAAGVRSVPHFDIDGEIVTGAQAAHLLRAAIMAAYAGRRGVDPAARTPTAGEEHDHGRPEPHRRSPGISAGLRAGPTTLGLMLPMAPLEEVSPIWHGRWHSRRGLAVNLRLSERPASEALEDLANDVLPHFPSRKAPPLHAAA